MKTDAGVPKFGSSVRPPQLCTLYVTNLLRNRYKFEVIFLRLDVFSVSFTVSTFLQSRSLNYLTAFNMTTNLAKEFHEKSNNGDKTFDKFYSNVQNYTWKINKE